ncbi:MAG: CPBP family intramembrane metalloprotease [Bacteroidaceae bacterium]|nr:CPBP family intramembrane metalloprotease [Bacteroidaceae bacterium]
MRKIKVTLLTILIWLAIQILGAIPMAIGSSVNSMGVLDRTLDETMLLAIGLLATQIIEIFLFWGIRYYNIQDTVRPFPEWKVLLLSLPLGFAVLYGIDLLATPLDLPDLLEEDLEGLCRNAIGIVSVAICGPIAEEIIMRRIILRNLEEATGSTWAGILISAAIFALIHANPVQIVFAFPAGVLLGWIYCRTGSLLVPICIHILNNSFSVITTRMGVTETPEGTLAWIELAICIAVAVPLIIWMNRHFKKMENADC